MRRAHDAGFALIETVIAAAIVAAMMAATYRVIDANAAADRAVRARRGAAMLAQSLLDQASAAPDAAAQASAGRSGAFAWRTTRTPYALAGADALQRVAVEIRGADGRVVLTLATLRLAR